MAGQTKQYPKDGLVLVSMLKEFGITNYEPRVVNQLLEFATRYVSCVLDDARAFANHSKKKTIDIDDVKLSIGMQMEKVFTTPPPRDLLLEVARSKNSIPLPAVKPHCGIRLPPDRYCFSACNYKLKPINKKASEKVKYSMSGSTGRSTNQMNTSGPPLKVTKTSSGSGSVANSGNSSSGVPLVKRSTPNNVARSQAITAVAKPLIKLTTNPVLTASQQQQQSASQLQSQQMVHPKARIQVTAEASSTSLLTGSSGVGGGAGGIGGSGTVLMSQQSQGQQPSPQMIEVKLEPMDTSSSSASAVLTVGDQQQIVGIKRKRDDDFGGLE